MTFTTYNDAQNALPREATWSCSFGYPGQPGFTEFWRASNGDRYTIRNDREWWAVRPFTWKVEKV